MALIVTFVFLETKLLFIGAVIETFGAVVSTGFGVGVAVGFGVGVGVGFGVGVAVGFGVGVGGTGVGVNVGVGAEVGVGVGVGVEFGAIPKLTVVDGPKVIATGAVVVALYPGGIVSETL